MIKIVNCHQSIQVALKCFDIYFHAGTIKSLILYGVRRELKSLMVE